MKGVFNSCLQCSYSWLQSDNKRQHWQRVCKLFRFIEYCRFKIRNTVHRMVWDHRNTALEGILFTTTPHKKISNTANPHVPLLEEVLVYSNFLHFWGKLHDIRTSYLSFFHSLQDSTLDHEGQQCFWKKQGH